MLGRMCFNLLIFVSVWQSFINFTAKIFFSETKILQGEKLEMFVFITLVGASFFYIFMGF